MIKNEIIEVNGQRWKIKQAISKFAALNEIAHARCTGSIGGKSEVDETRCGGVIRVIADVVKVNSDDTECKPYQKVY